MRDENNKLDQYVLLHLEVLILYTCLVLLR